MVDYLEDIKKLISRQYDIDEDTIEEDSFLEADLNITDLDLEDLVTQIEEKYQITIPPKTTTNFNQVADVVNYLYENVDQT